MFSRTLLHQEKSHKYVTKQVAIILKITEKTGNTTASTANINIPAGVGGAAIPVSTSHRTVTSTHQGSHTMGGGNNSPMISGSAPGEVSVSGVGESYSADKELSPFKAIDYENDYSTQECGTSILDCHSYACNSAGADAGAYMEQLLRDSSLANELRLLYHGLRGISVYI